MRLCAMMSPLLRLLEWDGISTRSTHVTCSGYHTHLTDGTHIWELPMRDGESELDGKAKTTRVVFSPKGSFTGSITEVTPHGPVIYPVQKPWDLLPQRLSKHQTDTLRR